MKTKDRLAAALRAASIKINPAEVAFFEALAKRAETGEFDDYGTAHVCGPTALHSILCAHGQHKFAARVAAGEFDATDEESDEWANGPEGREAMKAFPPDVRAALFGVYDA